MARGRVVSGACAKCGEAPADSFPIHWESLAEQLIGERWPNEIIGVLVATCARCGYRWRVRALDENTN